MAKYKVNGKVLYDTCFDSVVKLDKLGDCCLGTCIMLKSYFLSRGPNFPYRKWKYFLSHLHFLSHGYFGLGSNIEVLNICNAKEEQKRANCAIMVSAIVILHHASTCLEQPVFPSVPLVPHLASNLPFLLSPSLAVGAVLAIVSLL